MCNKQQTTIVEKKLTNAEQVQIQKGKDHWNLDVLNKMSGGYVKSTTIKSLIDKLIEDTWENAKAFYTRQRALEWWDNLPMYDMDTDCKRVLSARYYQTEPVYLSHEQIEIIWQKQTKQI